MAYTVPTSEPAQVRAGDTIKWTIALGDYPASEGWVLSYALVKTGTQITFGSSASGDDHLVNVAPATSGAWAAGKYSFAARVSKAGDVHTVRTGTIEILPSFAAQSSGYDARSHARKTLEALEAWIEGRDIAVAEYEIAGRRMRTIPIADLIALRDKYRAEVQAEDNAARLNAGLQSRNKLQVRI